MSIKLSTKSFKELMLIRSLVKLFHCLIVLGKKLCWWLVVEIDGMMNRYICNCLVGYDVGKNKMARR